MPAPHINRHILRHSMGVDFHFRNDQPGVAAVKVISNTLRGRSHAKVFRHEEKPIPRFQKKWFYHLILRYDLVKNHGRGVARRWISTDEYEMYLPYYCRKAPRCTYQSRKFMPEVCHLRQLRNKYC